MLKENIDNLIKTALLNKKKTDLKVLRLIKSEFQTFETSKDNKGNLNVLDDVQEVNILKKLKNLFQQIKALPKQSQKKARIKNTQNLIKIKKEEIKESKIIIKLIFKDLI